MISHKYKFIFFHVPKAAGSSILSAFKKHLGSDIVINDENKNLVRWLKYNSSVIWPNHITPTHLLKYLGPEIFYSYYKFGFVRNPYERLVSFYHYTKQKEEKIYKEKGIDLPPFSQNIINSNNFSDWIKTGNFGNAQSNFLSNPNGELLVDFIGQTENLQNDISYICGYLNIPKILIPLKNESNHSSYKSYLNSTNIKAINARYDKDFSNFSYKKLNDINLHLKDDTSRKLDNINIISIKGNNRWTNIPLKTTNQTIRLHPNSYKEEDQEILIQIINTNAQYLNIEAQTTNEKSFNKKIKVIIEHLNSLIIYENDLYHNNQMNILLPLGKSCNRIIKIKVLITENYSSDNFYCGIDFNLSLKK